MTSFQLKLIAVFAMTIDHLAKILGQAGLLALFPDASLKATHNALIVMNGVGRIAFPLFAFMIAEGALRTRSLPRYIGRLVIFALISEPFYYWAFGVNPSPAGFFESLAGLHLTNVFFTLALGALAIFLWQHMERCLSGRMRLLYLPVLAILVLLAGFLHTDYGAAGVILIVGLYFARTKPQKSALIVAWAVCLYLVGQLAGGGLGQVWTGPIVSCIGASLACVPLLLYNGQRGRPAKWIFYLYYPAHLLFIKLAAIGIGPTP